MLRKKGKPRSALTYKLYVLLYIVLMLFQAPLAIVSAALREMGFNGPYRQEAMSQIQKSDFVISTADENFKEGSLYLPINVYWTLTWWTILFSRMIDIIIAKKIFKKRVVIFPNSVGPFRSRLGLFMAKTIFKNTDLIMLREPCSYGLLKDLKVGTRCIVATDIALLLEIDKSKFNALLPGRTLGVCPSLYALSFSADQSRNYVLLHSKVLDYLVEKHGYNVVFLPHEISKVNLHDDLELSKAIVKNMKFKEKAEIVSTVGVEEFKYYLGQLDVLITSRMHPAVLACADHVPTLMITYDHKQSGFFTQLGLTEYTLIIGETTHEQLLKKIRLLLRNKENVRKQLETMIPVLQNDLRTKIRVTATCFSSMVRKE